QLISTYHLLLFTIGVIVGSAVQHSSGFSCGPFLEVNCPPLIYYNRCQTAYHQPSQFSGALCKKHFCFTDFAEPWPVEDLLNEDNITDKVPLQRLQLLGQSKELRDLLCNPHLRQLLRSIDSADSKEDAMKAAMQEPLFVEFSDQCLKIVEHEADM
uniref:Zinc finger HIT domain-containing protein n=1 Tax=Monopterus albus TaxID=43700 RepID=A0A3Q3QSH7_MONAL